MGKFLRDSQGNLVAIEGGLVLERILDRKPRDCQSCGFSKWVKKDKVFIIQGGSGNQCTTTQTTATATTTTTATTTNTAKERRTGERTSERTSTSAIHNNTRNNDSSVSNKNKNDVLNTSNNNSRSTNNNSNNNNNNNNIEDDTGVVEGVQAVDGGYVGGGSMEWICPDCALKRGLPVEFYHKNFHAPGNADARQKKAAQQKAERDAAANANATQKKNTTSSSASGLEKLLDITSSFCAQSHE